LSDVTSFSDGFLPRDARHSVVVLR